VPLVAAALENAPADRAALLQAMEVLSHRLTTAGAVLKLPPQGLAQALDEGLAPLIGRGLLGEDLRPSPGSAPVLAYYAASVWQRLGQTSPENAATRRT
jgi:glycerol-3-phosphate O-acyltransferase